MEPPVSDTSSPHPKSILERTPLYALHVAKAARVVPFAGYEMPVQYAPGVLKEHLHTRTAAGLFDVSHMGQLTVRARSGRLSDAALALERLIPVDVLGLKSGRQRYGLFTNQNGGILDDLMIAHRGDHFLLVVNAACKMADEAHLRTQLSDTCIIERLDRALIALQGPKAEAALARLAPACTGMMFMDVVTLDILGSECFLTRSGYTGEDGFEISVVPDSASRIAARLLEDETVEPIGLGARDSLRLEAGLCLYGSDLDETTTPVEAGLTWAMQAARRHRGEREGGFPGHTIILDQIAHGTSRCRVGLLAEGRAPIRAGTKLFTSEDASEHAGAVTSGGFGPTVDRPIAMGYLPPSAAAPGTVVFAEVRGKRLPMIATPLPFVPSRFKRGQRR
ncbi:glycine cleavage system aminomethyltransferase GcvT [uncultured Hyphomicrobium sp.]|uniref:glycine cleavage system aminomethyltransferase GcvT n=1 Tax=uncultured Hyphomicrobium sp. TaxID=194373 RepID=UPI0025CE00B1|nr:glycine cleavage system aminomethyltransferase GcvT [uncultured Hyphomicrobium sp.]